MAYWIQEFGGKGQSRTDFRLYHCDFESDIQNLPLNDKPGVQQENDTVSCTKAHYGDQAFILENSEVYELGKETNRWIKLG